MPFRIHDLAIHLAKPEEQEDVAPCTMLSGNNEEGGCGGNTKVERPCQEKTDKGKPRPDKPGKGGEGDLASLQARLRETLAPPPV